MLKAIAAVALLGVSLPLMALAQSASLRLVDPGNRVERLRRQLKIKEVWRPKTWHERLGE